MRPDETVMEMLCRLIVPLLEDAGRDPTEAVAYLEQQAQYREITRARIAIRHDFTAPSDPVPERGFRPPLS